MQQDNMHSAVARARMGGIREHHGTPMGIVSGLVDPSL